jgi:hypothetical protein
LDPNCCFGSLFIFIMGIVCVIGYYITLRQAMVETLEQRDRRMIIGTSLIMAYIMAFIASITFTGGWTLEEWRLLFAINIPLIFVLLAFFLIPTEVRGQIGIVVGTFIFAMAIGGWVSMAVFPWITLHPVIWMATGAMALMVAYEIAKPTPKELGLAVSTGLGLYMVFVSVVLINHVLTAEPTQQITRAPRQIVAGIMFLWTALGIITIAVRFSPESNHGVLFKGLSVTSVVCIGVGFMAFGAWFLRFNRFEGAIDFLIGLPVVYYGLYGVRGMKGKKLRIVLFMICYSILVEILTLSLILGVF